jgi:UDP-2-acetamido-3-amino-2,3-dideoxy-glucuronate N-acetyltransferase
MKQIGVIGTGYWGKNLVRNYHDIGALHTICDSNPAVVQTFLNKYKNIKGVTSYSDVLLNNEIDAIVIATPAETHFALAQEALLAGKDVYIEKPLCLSERDGRKLNVIAGQQKRILMTGHLLWYHPAVLKLKEMIRAGKLGRIRYIYSNRLNLGKLRREENVLWSFAPHDISVILGLIDEMPGFVMSQGGNYLHQQIADTTVTLLDFPSGVKAHIFVSWLHPFKEQKLVVVGDKQMAVFDDTAPWSEKLTVYPHSVEWNDNIPVANKAEARFVEITEEEPLRAECLHFLNCIENRKKPRTDGEEGLRVLQVLNCCQESLEKNSRVALCPKNQVQDSKFFAHESAEIDQDVSVGQGTKIWHFSHLLNGCNIGQNCSIGQNVVVGGNVTIGDNCKIQNNVSIYEGVTLVPYSVKAAIKNKKIRIRFYTIWL